MSQSDDKLEMFYCERLLGSLTRKSCAERSVRADAVKKGTDGFWIPEGWAAFIGTCRGCPIGQEHVERFGVVEPPKPGAPKPSRYIPQQSSKPSEAPTAPPTASQPLTRRPTFDCEECGRSFVPSSNRQKRCIECRTDTSFRLCIDCECAFEPPFGSNKKFGVRCDECRKEHERRRKREWARANYESKGVATRVCERCGGKFPDKQNKAKYCKGCRRSVRREQKRRAEHRRNKR